MAELTVERLFADPPLTGTLPSSLQLSPDGQTVAYLRLADDDRERMDLWRYRVDERRHERWVNAADLLERTGSLSDAEKAERERKRQFSRGITRYAFSADGSHVLLPVDGAGYLLETATGALRRFTPPQTRQTDLGLLGKEYAVGVGRHGVSLVRLWPIGRQSSSAGAGR